MASMCTCNYSQGHKLIKHIQDRYKNGNKHLKANTDNYKQIMLVIIIKARPRSLSVAAPSVRTHCPARNADPSGSGKVEGEKLLLIHISLHSGKRM